MKTSLIILTYNDGERTYDLVSKICGYNTPDSIILVNNASTDDTLSLLEKAQKLAPEKIHVISAPENGGYAKGNNFGAVYTLKNLSPDIIFMANPDTYFTEETVYAMTQALSDNPGYGVVAPLVSKGYNVWPVPGFTGLLESLFLIMFNIHKKAVKKRLLSSPLYLEDAGVVEGSFFAITSDAYKRIRGLDERTFIYAEEIILARRLMKENLKVGVLTGHFYDHLHSASIKKLSGGSKAAVFHHFHDSFRIYNKYYLHTNALQDLIFEAAYRLAYLERKIYDLIKR
ncbi:MAG: glycosyltransferase family 2 protein [Lachnospiraceae bacterium]|nr:glycosyltransferase family 2 protein [Lachnospiraceae bacterium]